MKNKIKETKRKRIITSFSFTTILYSSAHKRLSKYTISYFNSQLFNLTNYQQLLNYQLCFTQTMQG